MSEETVMTIDYAERYSLERLAQGDEDLILDMRNDFISAIDELRSTIVALCDHTEDGAQALERAHSRIAELEAQLAAALATIERNL